MRTPHPPLPDRPPGGYFGESDEDLAAVLRDGEEADTTRPVALLTARHWRPAFDYAVICLATSSQVASMVTEASFRHVLEGLGEGEQALALRPQLLVTVRDTVRTWAADDRMSEALPALKKPAGGRGMRAAKSMTAENRKLAEHAFLGLPGVARCLLWHTEVEAESLSVPAGLLGMDEPIAVAAWEQAREQFRQACLRAHLEFAPTRECGFHNRLLDAPIRRGGALLPDVQEHLSECSYCRYAAAQLSYFEGGLGLLIAESVLGWGARRYYDSRRARGRQGLRPRSVSRFRGRRQRAGESSGKDGRLLDDERPAGGERTGKDTRSGDDVRAESGEIPAGRGRAESGETPAVRGRAGTGGRRGGEGRGEGGASPAGGGRSGAGGRRRPQPLSASTGRRAARSAEVSQQALVTGAGLSAALLATVLAVSLWPNEEGGTDSAAAIGASSSRTLSPAQGSQVPPVMSTPSTAAEVASKGERTRLRNVDADLCLGLRDARAVEGAEATLDVCSSAWTQQWVYERDGLLRSVASAGLCLDARADDGVLLLGRCAGEDEKRREDMRYDLTDEGELLSRGRDGLAVAPASTNPGADIVVKVRDYSDIQRWRTERP
ncbi:RICIN domain-containing protein [Streptomyces sp. NBC_00151]|uniref:RICIN domain-containing protein n=1 Tax=Streptomyces sp. NBC_00151 TaxID=2975669 RepID=UPI002DD7FAE2|nr:RICIN domain-containing protein [Streptomyces sp. NBC_00151]WRZ37839.1 RICIN domain-containing protein [Streptomyces sp. NBC_00151]